MSARGMISRWAILTCCVVAVTECMALVALSLLHGEPFSLRDVKEARARAEASASIPSRARESLDQAWNLESPREVLHPYVGFTMDTPERGGGRGSGENIGQYGFFPQDAALRRTNPDDILTVGLFGGSFALNVLRDGTQNLLKEKLRNVPAFQGKNIEILNFGMAGFKQPQSLLALSYLLALGTTFDVVILIDGFNDVSLPIAENIPRQVFPFFPRMWSDRVTDLEDSDHLRLRGQISYLTQKRSEVAAIASRFPFRASFTASFLWNVLDLWFQRKIERRERAFLVAPLLGTYEQLGPGYSYPSESALAEDLVLVWKQSSLAMNALASANGIQFFHFLQPNQYVAGSKPLSRRERAVAFEENHPYRKGVVFGYPILQSEGKELRSLSVRFFDMTGVYRDHPEPLYVDACCHVGVEGNRIFIAAMARAITESLRRHP